MGAAARSSASDKKQDFVRAEVLPLRLEVARSYEAMIEAFVQCAKLPGEVGTIASIESSSCGQIVSTHDAAIVKLLGKPLPAEVDVRTDYRGSPRIFVSASCGQLQASRPQEIRAFMLSSQQPVEVKLY